MVSKINFQPDGYSKCATSGQCPLDIHSCLLVMRSVRYVMCNCETKCFVDELGFWWRMMCFVNAIYSAGGQVRSDKVHCLKEVSGLTDCQIIRSMTKGEKGLARKKKVKNVSKKVVKSNDRIFAFIELKKNYGIWDKLRLMFFTTCKSILLVSFKQLTQTNTTCK